MSKNALLGEIRDAADDLVDATRGPGRIWLPPSAWVLKSTGVVLAAFSDGASDVPGTQITNSKAHTIRWNNHAAPLPVMATIFWGEDVDTSVNAVFKAQLSKTGATGADATTLTLELWNQATAALHDADTDYGGATSALTGAATAKTIQSVSRTLTAADLPAGPASTTITMKPTAGLLGTDDLLFHMAWIEYTRKAY